jgi:hypothetical protein
MHFDRQRNALVGERGSLRVIEDDEVSRKFAMLIERECEGLGRSRHSATSRPPSALALLPPTSMPYNVRFSGASFARFRRAGVCTVSNA